MEAASEEADPPCIVRPPSCRGFAQPPLDSRLRGEADGRLPKSFVLLAEQSVELALEVSDFATVLQVGKSVLSGTAADLANDPQVQKAYLGTG